MIARIISGAVGVPIAIVLIFLGGGLPFTAAVAVVAVLGILEFYRGVQQAEVTAHIVPGVMACLAIIAFARLAGEGYSRLIFSLVLTALFLAMLVHELMREPSRPLRNVGSSLLGVAYVGGLFASMVLLRALPGRMKVWFAEADKAAWLLLFVFLSTWACDTSAYFIGRKFGRRKLIPRLSPGKSVEGSIAGFVGSLIIAVGLGIIIRLPIMHAAILGALIGVLCQVGDLVESSMKREIGIKDFGAILPGHGGVLDRFDSLLFTSTAVYYYAVYLLRAWLG